MNPLSSNPLEMNNRDKRQRKVEVIQCLIEHCQRPAQMPLGFLPVDKDVYACPANPGAVARALSERFSAEDLVESGVFTVEEREVASLAPTLIGAGSFIVLRDARSGTPYELLTRTGCLGVGALPLFEILHDGCTQRLLKSGTGDLVVAFDLEAVIMLRACGLPATLAIGLEAMPLDDVSRFCQSFGLECSGIDQEEEWRDENGNQSEDHPGDRIRHRMRNPEDKANADLMNGTSPSVDFHEEISSGQMEPQLVLLGWMPLELADSVPLSLKAVVDRLHDLQRFLGVDLYGIRFWEMDGEPLERLRFIAANQNPQIFKKALQDAVVDVANNIAHFGKEKPVRMGPPNDFVSALIRLREYSASQGGMPFVDPSQRNKAWGDVVRFLDQQVINPLRESALADDDPLKRNLLLLLAELSGSFHLRSISYCEQLSDRMMNRDNVRSDEVSERNINNLMAIADRMIGAAKAVQGCHSPKLTLTRTRILASQDFLRLPQSE
ncbi:hypothetical protein [Planctomicrobium sp. SH527]|uniref:hypothetical protein n=1 Tax=Planctomicrobium sp. SH527 TaxID=3448123 RepID=UPI003F5CAE09